MTEPSPLDQADAFRKARDLTSEIDTLTDANQALHAQPWYPLAQGDTVLVDLGDGEVKQYLALDDPEWNVDGTSLVLIAPDSPAAQEAVETWRTDFYTLWFEAGPGALTVRRDERVLFDHGKAVETP